jgi:lantibiotic modifying enzyme
VSTAPSSFAARPLEVAATIGFGLARKAVWSGDRCRWLEGVPVAPGQNPAVSMMCGIDVYGGTAGIGWFLAQAAARIPDPLLARTARGALRHAAAGGAALLGTAPHGFYGGAAGVGAALVLAGRALGDGDAVAAGRALLMKVPTKAKEPLATDLISGLAGTVLALAMAAAALDGDAALLRRAGKTAERLIAMGARDGAGTLSWPSMPDCRANLTGFAHGAAGIAHALLVLAALAPDERLTAAAAAAFAYEDKAFDPGRGNWPDYRILPGYPQDEIMYGVAWCHGAAGIARSRIAAAAAGMEVAAALDAGLRTTAAEVERLRTMPGLDFTLCHGLLGLADTLLDSARAGRADHGALVTAVAEHAAAVHHDGERPWPSGLITREESNGLMMGNAGIGHFYLRLADPALPSVLAPGGDLIGR